MTKQWSKLGGVLGIVYCVVGFFLIFLGWNGAASNDNEPAQLPYLISGGIGGLGLVVLGSALIVVQSLRADRVELVGAIDDLRGAIVEAGGDDGAESGRGRLVGRPSGRHRRPLGSGGGGTDLSAEVRGWVSPLDRAVNRVPGNGSQRHLSDRHRWRLGPR